MHLIEESAAEVLRFVSRRVQNPADAADISQQALLLAWAKFSTFRGDNVLAWLLAIARHLIVDHYRTQARVHFVTEDQATDEPGVPALWTAPHAVQMACEYQERIGVWREHITQLYLDQQVAVLLADTYEYTDKESAAMLHLSVPCFKLLLHGARARLREVAAEINVPAAESRALACDARAVRDDQAADEHEKATPPVSHPIPCLGVTRRLAMPELLALRARLLNGLGIGLHVLGCLFTDEFLYLLIV